MGFVRAAFGLVEFHRLGEKVRKLTALLQTKVWTSYFFLPWFRQAAFAAVLSAQQAPKQEKRDQAPAWWSEMIGGVSLATACDFNFVLPRTSREEPRDELCKWYALPYRNRC